MNKIIPPIVVFLPNNDHLIGCEFLCYERVVAVFLKRLLSVYVAYCKVSLCNAKLQQIITVGFIESDQKYVDCMRRSPCKGQKESLCNENILFGNFSANFMLSFMIIAISNP